MSSLDSQSSDPVLFGVIMGQEFYMWVLEVYDSALGVEKKQRKVLINILSMESIESFLKSFNFQSCFGTAKN